MAVHTFLSPEILISIFEFSDPENPTIHANIVSIAFTELKSAEFWFILTQFWLHSNSLGSLKISSSIFEFNKPYLHAKNF